MLSIEQIAEAITATPTEFAELFYQAQIGLGRRTPFVAIRQQAAGANPFLAALQKASVDGFLPRLLGWIADSRLETGVIMHDLAKQIAARDPGSPLQAVITRAQGFSQPDLAVAGYASAVRWTGNVFIDGVAKGTGLLIAPHLLLTAWHVVRQLFEPQGDQWRPSDAPGTSARITVEFDDFVSYFERGTQPRSPNPVTARAHPQWCPAWSECHSAEIDNRLPDDLSQLTGHWDYAVVRLTPPPGLERRWVSMTETAVVPRPEDDVIVFQHADGQPMTYGRAQIIGEPKTTVAALGRRRFLHSVNTTGGSSGGPCFDRDFQFFGIHQGVWAKGKRKKATANRGIPLARVMEHISERFELPPADAAELPIWDLGGEQQFAPVIGCSDFQTLVWKVAMTARKRIIIINGEADSGKTFQVSLLERMLHSGDHLKIVLDAQQVGTKDALAIAADICTRANVPTPAFGEATSTRSAWLKTEVADKVITALDSVRGTRQVWLALKELNHFEIKGEGASELLFLLYENALQRDWLRIVLDGIKRADLPETQLGIAEVFRVAPITEADIRTYLRRFVASLELNPQDVAIAATANTEWLKFEDAQTNASGSAIAALVNSLRFVAKGYLAQVGG